MTTEYKWEILSLYVVPHENGLDNIVESVNWRFQVQEDSSFGDVYDTTVLSRPSLTNYIAYDEIDHDTIVSWVKNQIDYDALVKLVDEKLYQNKTPAIVEKEPPFKKVEKYSGEEEYLIVFDDDSEKVWGPMRWSTRRANKGLDHYGINDFEFPFDITMYQKELLPVDGPKQVTDRVTLYKVEYTEQPPEFDNIYQYNEGIKWDLDTGNAVGTYFVHDRSIENVKNILIKKVDREFERKQNNAVVSINHNQNTYVANASPAFVSYLISLKNNFLMDNTTIVKLYNNEYIEVTEEELNNIITTIESEYQTLLKEEMDLVSNIRSANSIGDLKDLGVN